MNITLENVTKRFGDVVALDNVSLTVTSGELFFLLGPSGCGKTTLLRGLAGFLEFDRGRLLFEGHDVSGVPPHKRDAAMVFQGYALWPHMTVRQNVAFGLEMKRVSREERDSRVEAVLDQVQISELADRKPHELSGGQQQRTALARTLVVAPACLLLDEPLANLDAKLRTDMRAEIRRLCKTSGLTAVYVTHDQKEALSMADRLAVMRDGRVLQVGAPRDVYVRPADTFVAGFVGETNFIAARIVSRTGSSAEVETGFGRLHSRACPDRLAAGAKVTLSMRPEALQVASPLGGESGGANRVCARLVQSVYLGEMARHRVSIGNGMVLDVSELNPSLELLPDRELILSEAPEDVVILADG